MPKRKNKSQLLVRITLFAATLALSLGVSFAPGAHRVYAQNFEGRCEDAANVNPDTCGIVAYLQTAINILTAVVGVVIVIMVALGGVQYTLARDNPQESAAAKTRIYNALMALVIYLFSFAFLQYLVPGGVL